MSSKLNYLTGGGEMGELTRNYDWASHPLGAINTWPPLLLSTVGTILKSKFPMFLWWGSQFYQFYNDAYRTSLGISGKHPHALGQRGEDCWTETWPVIKPLIDRVLYDNEGCWFEDQMIPVYRNGSLENCYWTFSYSPLIDLDGSTAGVLVVCQETTEKVQLLNQLQAANLTLQRSQALIERQNHELKSFLTHNPGGVCILQGDDLVYTFVNDNYQQLFPDRQLLGRSVFKVFPELESQQLHNNILHVYQTGKSFTVNEQLFILPNANGEPSEHYYNFTMQAKVSSQGKIDGVLAFVYEVTQAVLARQREKELENRFRFVIDTMPQQVWICDATGKVVYVNAKVCENYGVDAHTLIESGLNYFVHPDDIGGVLEKWNQSLANGTAFTEVLRLRFADGEYRWHLSVAVPYEEDGMIKQWIGTNTDIDKQKANERKKDEFLSIASHELKTPLTTTKAFIQLAKKSFEQDSDQIWKFLVKSEEQTDRLLRLINDLLDVSKINAGNVVYNKTPFSFTQSLKHTVESMAQISRIHHITLQSNCDIDFNGDRDRLEQVFINLINNAIKYSPNGGEIIVRCEKEGQNIIVSVQDFGIGIAEDNLERLFDRFYRIDNSSLKFQGLGLGLYIVADIIKRHGGSFWIESEPNKGSTFSFLLPLNGRQELLDIDTDGRTYYHGSFVNIDFNAKENYIHVDWLGYQNYDSVTKGCSIMLSLMKASRCYRILNDNTRVSGNWSEASDWGAKVWFPQMAQAGLAKFAWIYSPSTFSRISSNKSVPQNYEGVDLQFFDDVAAAKKWLLCANALPVN